MSPRQALKANLARLLRPRHVAFVGGRVAIGAMERCTRFGFEGEMWLVNPKVGDGSKARVFASLSDLPKPPDAVYLALSPEKTVEAVGELAKLGAGGCICYAAGFAEKGGEGVALQEDLVEAAKDVALIGPNCFGLLDYRSGLHLWSGDVHPRFPGPGVGIVSQSGALAEFMTMEQRSMPFVSIVSVGNQAVLSLEHIVEAMLDDKGINAIGIYVEGIRDIPYFSRVAARALVQRIPIVAIKIGRSDTGSRLAKGHTSSIVGTAELYDALFERLGIIQVRSLSELLETLKLLSVSGPLPGTRIGVVTCSGGQAAMLADRAAPLGLELSPLAGSQVAALRAGLPDYVNPMNPLDMTISPMSDREQLALIFDVLAGGEVDVVTGAMDAYQDEEAPFSAEVKMMLEEMGKAVQRHGKVGIANSALHETLPAYIRDQALSAGITPIQGADEMLTAIAGAAFYGAKVEASKNRDPSTLVLAPTALSTGEVETVGEAEAKRQLASVGLRIPRGEVVGADGLITAAARVGYPVVLKVAGTLLHKTDAGAVVVGLQDEDELLDAVDRVTRSSVGSADQFLVEEMVGGIVAEVIVGVRHDPAFGYALVFGSGGVLVEILGDTQTLILPTDRASIRKSLDRLAVNKLLTGYRGVPEGDSAALLEAIESIAAFALQMEGSLIELEVNPLLVLEKGKGAVVVDALIRRIAEPRDRT